MPFSTPEPSPCFPTYNFLYLDNVLSCDRLTLGACFAQDKKDRSDTGATPKNYAQRKRAIKARLDCSARAEARLKYYRENALRLLYMSSRQYPSSVLVRAPVDTPTHRERSARKRFLGAQFLGYSASERECAQSGQNEETVPSVILPVTLLFKIVRRDYQGQRAQRSSQRKKIRWFSQNIAY